MIGIIMTADNIITKEILLATYWKNYRHNWFIVVIPVFGQLRNINAVYINF